MSHKLRYRRIHQDEIPMQREKFAAKYPWAPEPNWPTVWVRVKDGQVTGMVEVQQRILVATLDADDALAVRDMIVWIDGALSMYNSWECIVPEANVSFQRCVEKHFGITPMKHPGVLYIVDRED